MEREWTETEAEYERRLVFESLRMAESIVAHGEDTESPDVVGMSWDELQVTHPVDAPDDEIVHHEAARATIRDLYWQQLMMLHPELATIADGFERELAVAAMDDVPQIDGYHFASQYPGANDNVRRIEITVASCGMLRSELVRVYDVAPSGDGFRFGLLYDADGQMSLGVDTLSRRGDDEIDALEAADPTVKMRLREIMDGELDPAKLDEVLSEIRIYNEAIMPAAQLEQYVAKLREEYEFKRRFREIATAAGPVGNSLGMVEHLHKILEERTIQLAGEV